MIQVGVAGWSYPDWEGRVYPKPRPRGFDPLLYLSELVEVVEINTTFYHPVSRREAETWARKLSGRSGFKFTVKLWQRFTHEAEPFGEEEVEKARVALEVLAEAGLLAAALIQFPWSFRESEESRARIEKLVGFFAEFPLAVELRHGRWDQPALRDWFRKLGVALVSLDQPLLGNSLKPSAEPTTNFAYVRFHGRNEKDWFREDAGRDHRYHYLYSEEELKPWLDRLVRMDRKCDAVYVIFNNHFQGHAVTNALQLKRGLGLPVPGSTSCQGVLPFWEEGRENG